VDTYKYAVWVPGNCASVRLALQLASDCLVMKVESPEKEWYYGMLEPYRHYVPLHANATHVDVVEAVQWAESHPMEVTPSSHTFCWVWVPFLGNPSLSNQMTFSLGDNTLVCWRDPMEVLPVSCAGGSRLAKQGLLLYVLVQ
jgi:hypothetical protein